MKKFNIILKELRSAHGLTQDELSKKLKISRSSIGMYENGAREPDFETLELIADFFNVDINYLLGRSNKTTVIHSNAATITVNDIEEKIINEYRRSDDITKSMVLRVLSIDEPAEQHQKKVG